MHAYVADPETPPERREYRLSRVEVERQGRWTAYRRVLSAAALLWAAQFPAWMAAQGRWETAGGLPAGVPARISLVLDLGMILAYSFAGYRALELVASACAPPVFRAAARAAMTMLATGAVLDVIEDVLLWVRVGQAGARTSMSLPFTPLMVALVVAGLGGVSAAAVLSSPGLWWRRIPRAIKPRSWWRRRWLLPVVRRLARWFCPDGADLRWRNVLRHSNPPAAPTDQPDLIICCSGGGIRSASFCLGGLQTLTEKGEYAKAHAVVGVSGGGYIAAAYHVARWQSAAPGQPSWPRLDEVPVFSSNSPELRWLRRNTRYLLDSARVAVLGVLSVLFGVAVNLVLLAAVLGGLAWWFGWMLTASGGIRGWATDDASAGWYAQDWVWAGRAWWLVIAGVALFVAEKVADHYATARVEWREHVRTLSFAALVAGLVGTLLLVWLPGLLEALHDYAATTGSGYARLIHAIGLVPDEVCRARLAVGSDACGFPGAAKPTDANLSTAMVSAGSLMTIVAAVLAAVKAAGSALSTDSTTAGARRLTARIWARVRIVVTPWLAALVIGVLATGLLLRWTSTLLAEPDLLANWGVVYLVAGLMLAIKLGTDANRTSLHHFYRERLSHAYLVRRSGGQVRPLSYRRPVRFSESAPAHGPRLVTCAVANVGDNELIPSERGCTPFVFDDATIGLTDHLLPAGQALTASGAYEYAADVRHRDATIPAAMAISGAAFSPLAGRQNLRVGPYRLVLALANARLGVWLPNPIWVDEVATARRLIKARMERDAAAAWSRLTPAEQEALFRDRLSDRDRAWLHAVAPPAPGDLRPWFAPPAGVRPGTGGARAYRLAEWAREILTKPGPFRLVKEAVGRTSVLDRLLYVTDGGHYDNLGLVEALRRQPKRIIVLDASSDPEDSFEALGQAIATARMDLDCEVDFDPREMRKLDKARSTAAWGSGHVRYRDGTEGTIALAKVILVDGLPWDLETYSASHPQFPRTSTGKQTYGEFDLEAYRVLGREVTRRLIENPGQAPPAQTDLRIGTVRVGHLHVGVASPNGSGRARATVRRSAGNRRQR